MASEQLVFASLGKMFLGELSLDGQLRPVPGVLAAAIKAADLGIAELFVPKKNAKEAALVAGITVYPVESLKQLFSHLSGFSLLSPEPRQDPENILQNLYQLL